MAEQFDRIIIGAGLYGLYAAEYCGNRGQKVLVLEYDDAAFKRATYINQARVHMGYHYPRSLSTAMKSAGYFQRFVKDYAFCIHDKFDQVYATSADFSWTDARQFMDFCKASGIRCDEINPDKYFQKGMCDGAFLTQEYTYDAFLLRDNFVEKLQGLSNVSVQYSARIHKIIKSEKSFILQMEDGAEYEAPFLLNATYASVNQIIDLVEGMEKEYFGIKYELCEIILCEPSENLKNVGLTVMDGPFFSIMPFGKTGYHSLTSVMFTPHVQSKDLKPNFTCQKSEYCTAKQLGNCNACPHKPESAWEYMSHLANKYMLPEYGYKYVESLYSMKPILQSSEIDDSRPTAIKVLHKEPTFISVLSGKINTVYDLDDYLV